MLKSIATKTQQHIKRVCTELGISKPRDNFFASIAKDDINKIIAAQKKNITTPCKQFVCKSWISSQNYHIDNGAKSNSTRESIMNSLILMASSNNEVSLKDSIYTDGIKSLFINKKDLKCT